MPPEPATLPAAPRTALERSASLAAIGVALPGRRVDSAEIAAQLGVDAEWIVQRTGIRGRRHAADGETLAGLAAAAGERALVAAGVEPAAIDLVLVATFTADHVIPNAAPLVADALGARGAAAADVGAACTGFLSALDIAAGQIESGRSERALVIGADLASRLLDPLDRKTAGLFADGAGAAVLGVGSAGGGELGRIIIRSDARQAECIYAEHDDRLIRMQGQDTFRAAVDGLSEVTLELLEAEGIGIGDVDLFVYHQANARITRAVGERLALPSERVVDCIAETGNTSAATLPLALHHAAGEGRLEPGARVLLGAFGAGFVWGAGLLRWGAEVAA